MYIHTRAWEVDVVRSSKEGRHVARPHILSKLILHDALPLMIRQDAENDNQLLQVSEPQQPSLAQERIPESIPPPHRPPSIAGYAKASGLVEAGRSAVSSSDPGPYIIDEYAVC